MAIVINGSGTVTGLSVGGLPDGTVDNDTIASGVVSSKLTGALPAISGASLTNLPAADRAYFSVASTNQNSGSSGANHKVQWKQSAILVDNKSGWDNSNYWWTVPSGYAGTYLISCTVGMASMTTNQVKGRLMKNNDLLLENHFDANNANTSFHAISLPMTTLVTLAVGDDIWASFYHADGTASSKDNSSSLVIMQLT